MKNELGDPLGSLTDYLASRGLLSGRLSGLESTAACAFPEATTIVAAVYGNGAGAVVAADRRASSGHRIAKDDMTKLFLADRMSVVGIAGTAGIGVELARLFALELEHVEKIERAPLTHEGKVRRLSILVQSHLGLALQGLAAVPIAVGFDERLERVRVHTFDATGGAYEEAHTAALGSGGDIARAVLDARYAAEQTGAPAERHAGVAPSWDSSAATRAVLTALDAASRRDSATSGLRGDAPPVVVTVDREGARFVDEPQVARCVQEVSA